MELQFKAEVFYEAFGRDFDKWPEYITDRYSSWDFSRNSRKNHGLDLEKMKAEDVEKIRDACFKLNEETDEYLYKNVGNKVKAFLLLSTDIQGKERARKLEHVPLVIKNFVAAHCPHRFLFRKKGEESLMPYYLHEVRYYKAEGRRNSDYYREAYVRMTLKYYERGDDRDLSYNIYTSHVGRTATEYLKMCGLHIETPDMIAQYKEHLMRYFSLVDKTGLQMYAIGTAKREGSSNSWGWHRLENIEMIREGEPTKVIIDDLADSDEDSYKVKRSVADDQKVQAKFWGEPIIRLNPGGEDILPRALQEKPMVDEESEEVIDDEVDYEEPIAWLPLHPTLKIFDISRHEYSIIEIDNLQDYPWNKQLIDKLILPDAHKKLINMLIESTKQKQEDIIKGKMSGVIVLATGLPGVGKTLTAEVFGEFIEKPLYSVQCSQLGLEINDIETNLSLALQRAARWGAILLIDEADVYIRERGDDILQNAIVGVFLRLLEYYPGVLFMTSNRGDIIDDAILSRSTAWIQYENPDENLLRQLWKVLGENYHKTFDDKEIDELIKDEKLSHISGRTVRNLLKLAAMLASDEKSEITVELIKQVSQYQQLK